MYPRSTGEVYICGCGGSEYVDSGRLMPGGDLDRADLVSTDESRVRAASASFLGLSKSVGTGGPEKTQTCMYVWAGFPESRLPSVLCSHTRPDEGRVTSANTRLTLCFKKSQGAPVPPTRCLSWAACPDSKARICSARTTAGESCGRLFQERRWRS